jgi:DNA-directed RNA polymerase specialized sigma24 family protein
LEPCAAALSFVQSATTMVLGSAGYREAYRDVLRTARRYTPSADEARELAQDAFVAALARGFDDWSAPTRRAWLHGVVRRRAAFLARSHARRRRREGLVDAASPTSAAWAWHPAFLASLAPSLRVVAALASADLCAAEIQWLLGLTGTALRKRLSALRQAVRAEPELPTTSAPEPHYALGARRAELLTSLRRQQAPALATHDPDGHPILLRVVAHSKGAPGNCSKPNRSLL